MDNENYKSWVAFIILVGLLASFLSGCGLMGVREFEMWDGGPKWQFAEGLDFTIGANSVDNVKNQRGVMPRSAGTNLKEVKY